MSSDKFILGPIKHFILLGLSDFADELEALCNSKGIKFYYLTCSDQEQYSTYSGKNIFVTDDLNDEGLLTFLDYPKDKPEEILAFSFGARWIIKNKTNEKLFCGNLINAHGARLPIDRGGGGYSWRIMRGDRIGLLLLHVINDGVDTGPLLKTKEYVIPRHVKTPSEFMVDYRERLKPFLFDFFQNAIENTTNVSPQPQQSFSGTLFPRLDTTSHGFINWSWPPNDIENFILAFDEPFSGASTFWNGKRLKIKSAQLHVGEIGFHPYQSGLVFRNNQEWLMVALSDKYSLIVESITGSNGEDMMPYINEGDRLYTPSECLEDALSKRVKIGPKGL